MTTSGSHQALDRHEIVIDGHRYRTDGPVSSFLVSRRPGKVTVGDYTNVSNPMASEFSLGDWRDGIGVDRGDIETDLKRVWWSTGQIRYRDAFVLPRLAVQTAAGPSEDIQQIFVWKNNVHATYGTSVRTYDSSDNWDSVFANLSNNATDVAIGMLPGVDRVPSEHLIIAYGTGIYWNYGTDSGTDDEQPIKYVTFWNDLLWGITSDGALYYSDDVDDSINASKVWTADAQLPLPTGSVRGLIVARGPDREQHIYAVTDRGLYVHDDVNARLLPTDLQLPQHVEGGKGHEVWRGNTYTSAGNAIYAFQAGSDQTVVGVVGPDLDDGMPSDKRGTVDLLVGSHNELLAVVNASGADNGPSSLTTRATRGFRTHRSATFGATTGFSSILGWNERGWEVKWLSGSATRDITAATVDTAGGNYRLWWSNDQRVYYMDLPVDVVNPIQISTQAYDSSAELETPWFDMGVRNQQKLALSAVVETVNPSSSETVKIEYATNLDETYTTLATQDTTGEIEYRLPKGSGEEGLPFRQWKWKITLARGATNTSTPQLVRITLVWRPRIETLWGAAAALDLTEAYAGVPPVQQMENLRASLNKGTLSRVTYRDDKNAEQTYLMDWLDLSTTEQAGSQTYGIVRVTLGEPIATRSDFLHTRD